jgi:hypothetical protein
MISGTSAAVETTATSAGWRRTTRAHAAHIPLPGFGFGRMNAGSDSQAIRCPSRPRNAGSSDTATATAVTTAIAAAMPSELTSGIPATPSESRAMTTVHPAKTIALPDVATAVAIDSTMGMPSRSWSWCRVTRNSE